MRVRHPSSLLLATFLLLTAWGTEAVASGDCVVPVLMRQGDEVTVTFEHIADNGVTVLTPDSGVITPLMPLTPGMSGDLVRAADRESLVLRCQDDTLKPSVQEDGGLRALQPVPMDNYRRFRLRANVISADGIRRALLIFPDRRAVDDSEAPVIDLFQGMVPLQPGDHSVTLEVGELVAAAPLTGSAPMSFSADFMLVPAAVDGIEIGDFIVDLGASRSLIIRDFLPAGTAVHEMVATEYSAEGERTISQSAQAFGGEAAAATSLASLDGLRVGEIEIDEVDVLVLDEPFAINGRQFAGILGLDVLRRAGRVAFGYPADREAALLELGVPKIPADAVRVPVATVSKLLFAKALFGDTSVDLMLDTGARHSMLPSTLAAELGIVPLEGVVDTLRGLDGNPVHAARGIAPRMLLGDVALDDQAFSTLDIPVFDAIGLDDRVGLLGQPFWSQFERIIVDFEEMALYLVVRD